MKIRRSKLSGSNFSRGKLSASKLGRCLKNHPTSIAQNCSLLKTEN